MKKIEIRTKKQSNGLWGCPIACHAISNMRWVGDEKMLKYSAIIMALAELNQGGFSIRDVDDDGFKVDFTDFNYKKYRILFDRYEVADNILYDFTGDELGRKTYLRKIKLKKLNGRFKKVN